MKKMKDAHTRSYHLEVFIDMRILEVVHFVYHSHRCFYEGVGAEGTGAFAQPHAETEQRTGLHEVEQALVACLIADMAEDGIVEQGRVEA